MQTSGIRADQFFHVQPGSEHHIFLVRTKYKKKYFALVTFKGIQKCENFRTPIFNF